MLMLWEDLLPGDKIKLTKEAMNYWGNSSKTLFSMFNKILVIERIECSKDRVCIYIVGYKNNYVWIDKNGINQIILFELVELAED